LLQCFVHSKHCPTFFLEILAAPFYVLRLKQIPLPAKK
jgi:hypothetical protein